jgi:hypothetical protein
MGGGSIPNVKLRAELARVVPTMRPMEDLVRSDEAWCLANNEGDALIFMKQPGNALEINAKNDGAHFRLHWIDGKTNDVVTEEVVAINQPLRVHPKTNLLWLESMRDK